mmetsp:Transcript_94217/g.270129  ORF Transcript_94217/g.270129 Transcript_94217/m.270129 type:complete len:226 (+) Transcript_94217:481-1158(+)
MISRQARSGSKASRRALRSCVCQCTSGSRWTWSSSPGPSSKMVSLQTTAAPRHSSSSWSSVPAELLFPSVQSGSDGGLCSTRSAFGNSCRLWALGRRSQSCASAGHGTGSRRHESMTSVQSLGQRSWRCLCPARASGRPCRPLGRAKPLGSRSGGADPPPSTPSPPASSEAPRLQAWAVGSQCPKSVGPRWSRRQPCVAGMIWWMMLLPTWPRSGRKRSSWTRRP